LRRGLTPIVLGVAAGVGLSLIASGVLRGQLYGVSAADPSTLFAVGMPLLTVSVMATYVPARRAMRVSPIEALAGLSS
jgi:putative ABC transport system permease protein